jgi:heme exporter protein CcmD
MDLGAHAGFVWAAYAIAAAALGLLSVWLVLDGRRQRRLLNTLEARRQRGTEDASLRDGASHAR